MRRDNSKLVKEGMPDWIECPPVDPSKKLHPYEKPVALLSNLLSRVALPGQILYDPFMGSGSSIEAGYLSKLFTIGCELDTAAYAMAMSRVAQLVSKK
jgi:site-specific DNA-methyltransferase (adenine-specific)